MRLDKFIGNSTDWSRSQIQRALKRGEIQVNGVTARRAAQSVSAQDKVTLDGTPVATPAPRYLMLYKPDGVVCARIDSDQPCVMDLITSNHKQGLQIVGRLDKDTTGLLLLTDDGQWNHRITAPNRRCPKTYRVTAAEAFAPDTAERLAAGLQLRNEKRPTLPARFEALNSHTALVTVYEGRYHQVKRMIAALNNRVVDLHRQSVGGIELDPHLAPGEWRPLTAEEVASV